MSVSKILVSEVEIGDRIWWKPSGSEGAWFNVDGWFVDGMGRFVLEFAERLHPMSRFTVIEVIRD